MNAQESEAHLLTDDELDAVAGGERNIENPIVITAILAFVATAKVPFWIYGGQGC